ncbi:putative Vacuolar protein sorting-associated protein [Quillaja saponaria]|uniref:Vacuolar protein sorting-associated protein n=1 Tax=Quillaja saponaria TaxID=32244 RepID=A0AAD7QAV4_QUISA|nr:putative Vacuolar protein sorting-associated protein [Quillaja saponaria]
MVNMNSVFLFHLLTVWLHLSEWNEVLNLFNHYTDLLAKSTQPSAPSKKLSSDDVDSLEVADSPSCLPSINLSSHSAKENMKGDVLFLIIRSEIVGITFHLPVWVSGEPSTEFQLEDDHSLKPWSASSDIVEETNSRVVTVTLQFKSFELFVGSGNIRLKLYMEKLGGMIKICENQSCLSWPFFEFFQVYVDSDISNDGMEVGQVKVEIQCDRSNVWLSHPAFYFWSGLQFNVPESGSSQFSSGGVDFKFQLRKVSFLLSEEKWSCSGPLLEVLMRNLLLHVNVAGENMECSVTSDLHVNYNNIHKVVWEPFIEPWQFEMTLIRKYEMNVLVDSAVTTDILLKSTEQLNLNITESFVECVSRTIEMIKDAWVVIHDLPEGQKFLVSPFAEYMSTRRYAPYVVQNLTSVPLQYHVYQGSINPDECYDTELKEGNYVQPGSSVPIFIHENTKEQQFHNRPSHSSDSLHEQKLNGFAHNYITIKLDGTSMPSAPMSMDLVGLTFFEVNFSKTYNEAADKNGTNTATAFVVPVVFDVSVQRYSKLIRLYSTVVLSNATATPLELRFDIPFGVSPKILDPIYPGQELPLPLHLAEAGYLRWRPIGNSYLWSEAHNLSNLLSLENRIGFLKSFVCYPSHPSSDPFRCCISVRNISLTSSGRPKKDSPLHDINEARKRFVYCVTISAPFIVNNNLPKEISLTTESSGVNRTTIITEKLLFIILILHKTLDWRSILMDSDHQI